MQRRTLLRLGLGAAAVLAVAGGGIALLQPGLKGGHLTDAARTVMRAVANAVLDGVLPVEPRQRQAALDAHLGRLDTAVAAFPASTRAELSQLLALLASMPGRVALAELTAPWDQAGIDVVQNSLQRLRTSSLQLKQQAYHALRDLTNAAYFSDSSAWRHMGYPGLDEI